MSFFDDSHVTDVGLQGSAGPSVGFFDMVSQGFEQQFRVDSARALDAELQNRWMESISKLRENGQTFEAPVDPTIFRSFAQYTQGQAIDTPRLTTGYGYGAKFTDERMAPEEFLKDMIAANEAIKKLNNPDVKSFEQVLAEVAEMQRGVETETSAMEERTGVGGTIGGLIGAIGGSFTTRDPLNIITAPWGAGRTVATRVASEMALAGATTGVTEIMDVAPARELAGLPERDPVFNIAAAAIGGGIIRGGIEGVGAALRATPAFQQRQALREAEALQFDARDTSLRAMLETLPESPRARAAISALDDSTFVERNNPYGGGPAANERFIAELAQVASAVSGAPMTAIARTMPPVPFKYIKEAADFALVKEQRPLIYARLEQVQTKVAALDQQIAEAFNPVKLDLIEAVRLVDDEAAGQLEQLRVRVTDETIPEPERVAADIQAQTIVQRVGIDKINKAADDVEIPKKYEVRSLRASRRAAHKEYRAVYRQVEAEAIRLRENEARLVAQQQREGSNILAQVNEGQPFVGPLLRYDNVESLVARINKVNDTFEETIDARFARETVGEGEDKIEVEVWERESGIDIGLRDPVDPNFRVVLEDGSEVTVADAMRDLQDDFDLVEAIRSCAI